MTEPVAGVVKKPVLLIVEEEEGVRHLLELALSHHGFYVLTAASGAQAIRVYQKFRDDIQLVLMEVRMGDLNGRETLNKLREINPNVRCCLMSGDTTQQQADELLGEGVAHVLRKPFLSLADLGNRLHQCLKEV